MNEKEDELQFACSHFHVNWKSVNVLTVGNLINGNSLWARWKVDFAR